MVKNSVRKLIGKMAFTSKLTAIKLILENLIDKILLFNVKQYLATGKSLCEYVYCRPKFDLVDRCLISSDTSVFRPLYKELVSSIHD